ncbi:hypothetical protein Q7P37_008413 [Cladosporium fusiforme]
MLVCVHAHTAPERESPAASIPTGGKSAQRRGRHLHFQIILGLRPTFSPPPTKRRRTSDTAEVQTTSFLGCPTQVSANAAPTQTTSGDLDEMLHVLAAPAKRNGSFWEDPASGLEASFSISPSDSSNSVYFDIFSDSYLGAATAPQNFPATQQILHQNNWPNKASASNASTYSTTFSDSHTLSLDGRLSNFPYSSELSAFSPDEAELQQLSCVEDGTREKDASRHGTVQRRKSTTGDSPFSAELGLMTTTNNAMITDSLLGIYHDVLENNLACWLSENTCPYKLRSSRQPDVALRMPITPTSNIHQVGSATWSNRIYHRVVQLDRVARKSGQLCLTRAENRAVSKALSLAIMAFATQWSQGKSRRLSKPWERKVNEFEDSDLDDEDDFEQNIKESTWDQAKRALEACSDLESYRVVYAELIFGLVQKPGEHHSDPKSHSSEHKGSLAQQRHIVKRMLASQNQSAIVQRATRKAHTMKFRLDAAEAGFGTLTIGDDMPAQLSAENRSTVGLLYWLAVMLDTVSSSISENPVALADEDCQHEDLEANLNDSNLLFRRRWEARLFVQDDLDSPSLSLSWPCGSEDAAEAVTRSAPVKVLLFRYISYIQNALRKRQFGQAIEETIRGALLLYGYWNKTYSSFFRGLIRDYDSVPPRIKSWFVCIVVPWHLGALMLADLIEFIDSNNIGLEQPSNLRLAQNMHSEIRKTSANELADIANATIPSHNDTSSRHLPEFHFAVNQGSLLTEPWTALLVNAYAKAALYHLEILGKLEKQEVPFPGCNSEAMQDAIQRVDSCAQCLWFLGRKAEVAGEIAVVFLEAIKHHRSERPVA